MKTRISIQKTWLPAALLCTIFLLFQKTAMAQMNTDQNSKVIKPDMLEKITPAPMAPVPYDFRTEIVPGGALDTFSISDPVIDEMNHVNPNKINDTSGPDKLNRKTLKEKQKSPPKSSWQRKQEEK